MEWKGIIGDSMVIWPHEIVYETLEEHQQRGGLFHWEGTLKVSTLERVRSTGFRWDGHGWI